jgi:hypothetical protein
MRSLGIVTVILLLAAGCKKPKPTEPDSSPPPVTPNSGGGGGGGGGGIVPAGGVGIVINPGGALGGGGGGGAIQQVRKAARRTEALTELHNLGLVIESLRDDFGKMPTKDRILAALKSPEYSKILTGINEGAYILTGTTEGGGLWAYEVEADVRPGIALIGGKATRSTPDQLAPYLRK